MLSIALLLFIARLSFQWCTGWTRVVITIATVIAFSMPSEGPFRPRRASAEDQFGDRNQYNQPRRANDQRGTGILAESSADLPTQVEFLREGTLIPPTTGRFVMMGRRWAFVPASVDDGWDEAPTTGSTGVRFDAPRRRSNSLSSPVGIPLLGLENASPALALPKLMVIENLMLQRIVEAIRADTSDDRWTITGIVTEFFDENRLVIRTAQRANSR